MSHLFKRLQLDVLYSLYVPKHNKEHKEIIQKWNDKDGVNDVDNVCRPIEKKKIRNGNSSSIRRIFQHACFELICFVYIFNFYTARVYHNKALNIYL